MSTPKEQWLTTEALVYSAYWFEGNRNYESHYDVVYSYKVGEERYAGNCTDCYKGDSPLHANDTISIRYCPEQPTKSYYPDAHPPAINRGLMFAIGAAAGVVAMIIYCFGHRPN